MTNAQLSSVYRIASALPKKNFLELQLFVPPCKPAQMLEFKSAQINQMNLNVKNASINDQIGK